MPVVNGTFVPDYILQVARMYDNWPTRPLTSCDYHFCNPTYLEQEAIAVHVSDKGKVPVYEPQEIRKLLDRDSLLVTRVKWQEIRLLIYKL